MAIALTKELLTTEAEEQAKKLVAERSDDKNDSIKTQLRKFYNDFLLLKNKADLKNEEGFKKDVLPLIGLAKAKIAYAYGRDQKVPKVFVDDMNNKIKNIETKADFNNFINYYQALIGYVTYLYQIKKEQKDQEKNSNKQNNFGKYSYTAKRY